MYRQLVTVKTAKHKYFERHALDHIVLQHENRIPDETTTMGQLGLLRPKDNVIALRALEQDMIKDPQLLGDLQLNASNVRHAPGFLNPQVIEDDSSVCGESSVQPLGLAAKRRRSCDGDSELSRSNIHASDSPQGVQPDTNREPTPFPHHLPPMHLHNDIDVKFNSSIFGEYAESHQIMGPSVGPFIAPSPPNLPASLPECNPAHDDSSGEAPSHAADIDNDHDADTMQLQPEMEDMIDYDAGIEPDQDADTMQLQPEMEDKVNYHADVASDHEADTMQLQTKIQVSLKNHHATAPSHSAATMKIKSLLHR